MYYTVLCCGRGYCAGILSDTAHSEMSGEGGRCRDCIWHCPQWDEWGGGTVQGLYLTLPAVRWVGRGDSAGILSDTAHSEMSGEGGRCRDCIWHCPQWDEWGGGTVQGLYLTLPAVRWVGRGDGAGILSDTAHSEMSGEGVLCRDSIWHCPQWD